MDFASTPSNASDSNEYPGAIPVQFDSSHDANTKRRSSSRSIKRRRFDDELVEYSLSLPGASVGKGEKRIRTQSYTSQVLELSGAATPKPPAPSHDRRRTTKIGGVGIGRKSHRKGQLSQLSTKDLGRWKPTDDLALIIGVQQTNDLRMVHRGIKFSCRFTVGELQSRWYALLYNAEISRVAIAAMRNLHPDLVAAVQQQALYSTAEEELLGTLTSNSHPALEKFQELLEQNPSVFYPTRTAKSLMAHWQLMKQYQLLPDQVVQPLPKGQGDEVLTFSDAEDTMNDSELPDYKEDGIDIEMQLADRIEKKNIRLLENSLSRWQVLVQSVAGGNVELDKNTLAVLRGRLVRYLMRSREIAVGRSTRDHTIDVDLSLEGPSAKVSRKQATIRLRNSGDFFISSEGKRPIFVDGRPILQGNKVKLNHNSVIEDYSMDCYFRQYWRDTRLSFLGPIRSLSLSIKMLERIWRPDTYFYNGKHSYVHTITVPNKLLRISQHGDILYSMRLTIKAKCPMELRNFPMDRQSCPLILGSYAYSNQQLVYQWQNSQSVNFVPGMTLSQFDLISFPYRNFTFTRREGDFSVLQVSFNLQRHTGYFLIQVYVPCILIVVLSWVSFWIHREATSDRVGLGITTVLTLSTISLDSRTDLPKVRYATALDWFLLMSFFYCIATLLEFAGVHYFTKVGSGEIVIDDSEWEELIEEVGGDAFAARQLAVRRRSSTRSGDNSETNKEGDSSEPTEENTVRLTVERTTQTETRVPRWRQVMYCLAGDEQYRRQRQREAGNRGHINSVSLIDRAARVMFPASFALLNLFYWMVYAFSSDDFDWSKNPISTLSH